MGNQANKQKSVTTVNEELKSLQLCYESIASFNAVVRDSDVQLPKMVAQNLTQAWSTLIDPYLAQCTSHFLLKPNIMYLSFEQFLKPHNIVAHGTADKKAQFLFESVNKTGETLLNIQNFEKYVGSVLRSFILLLQKSNCSRFETWTKNGVQSNNENEICFVKSITSNLVYGDNNMIDVHNLETWLYGNSLFLLIWHYVFTELYSFNRGQLAKSERHLATAMIPVLEGIHEQLNTNTNYTPIVDIAHVIYLNSNLPNEIRHKWRILFSSKTMGGSFSTMLGKILNKGPTLLIVEDEDNYIFGGYAPASWCLSPLFLGDDTSMLFTLNPSMRCFDTTGYNNHYQYLNLSQQTMPNGLGMGGQFGFWGLWIDSDYGIGQSSKSCTTYRDYVQLSKRNDFKIRHFEVFGLGDEPKKDEDSEEKHTSVLDKNMEDRVMLELSGKKMNSDGLRDPDLDL